jgi:hypothetical protein
MQGETLRFLPLAIPHRAEGFLRKLFASLFSGYARRSGALRGILDFETHID